MRMPKLFRFFSRKAPAYAAAFGDEDALFSEPVEEWDTGSQGALRDFDNEDPARAGAQRNSLLALFEEGVSGWAPSDFEHVCSAFDVSQPAGHPNNLSGREEELGKLLSGILYRRNHAIIAGPRGSGKTSLASVLGYFAEKRGAKVVYSSCGSGTTFGQLFREVLEQVPYALVRPELADVFEVRVSELGAASNPSEVIKALSLLTYSQLIIIVDEYDRTDDPNMHNAMASVMKIVSDLRLPVRLLLAGSAETVTQLIEEHPSLLRNLTEVVTNPLAAEQVGQVLDVCAEECGMVFAGESKAMIHEVSCGSPYHTRLFGMHAALEALRAGTPHIEPVHVTSGLAQSFDEWAKFNREDARIFRTIVDGWHGSPAHNLSLARSFAESKVSDSPLDRHSVLDDNRPETRRKALSAFGAAIEEKGADFSFRDSMAPQFLLALQSARNSSAKGCMATETSR